MLLSSTTTKLLDFSRNLIVISQVHKQQNASEWTAHHVCTSYKHVIIQQNKQFGSDFEYVTCPLLASTHAFILLLKFLTTLLVASRPRSLAVLAW